MSKKHEEENVCDAAYDEMSKFENFYVGHWKKIVQICIAGLLVLSVYLLVSYFNRLNERKIAAEICRASTVEEIKSIVAKYPRSPASDFARMRLAKLLFDEKKYAECGEIFNTLSKSNVAELSSRARLNIAYLLEIEGKESEAAGKFKELSLIPGSSEEVRAESAYSAARIFAKLSKKEDALSSLEFVKKLDPEKKESFWAQNAKRLEEMLN